MTRFSNERVRAHLDNLDQQILYLLQFQEITLEELVQDKTKLYAVFHAFQIAIQNIMDIAGHILVSVFRESYDEYKQLVPALGKRGVVPQEFVAKCSGIAEFRNKLVHGYLSVDPEKVHGYLTTELPLLREYARYIVEWLERQKGEE